MTGQLKRDVGLTVVAFVFMLAFFLHDGLGWLSVAGLVAGYSAVVFGDEPIPNGLLFRVRNLAVHAVFLAGLVGAEYLYNTRNNAFPEWMTERLSDGMYLGEWARLGMYTAVAFVEKVMLFGWSQSRGD